MTTQMKNAFSELGIGMDDEECEFDEMLYSGRRNTSYSPELKMRVVLDCLRGDRTQSAIATEYKVSQPLISIWKRRALQAMMDSLASDQRRAAKCVASEKILARKAADRSVTIAILRRTLGKLTAALEEDAAR